MATCPNCNKDHTEVLENHIDDLVPFVAALVELESTSYEEAVPEAVKIFVETEVRGHSLTTVERLTKFGAAMFMVGAMNADRLDAKQQPNASEEQKDIYRSTLREVEESRNNPQPLKDLIDSLAIAFNIPLDQIHVFNIDSDQTPEESPEKPVDPTLN